MKRTFAILASLFTLTFTAWASQAETYGTMMVVKGDIKVSSAKSGKVEAGKVGFKVYEGDAIVAGTDSRAKIIMSDKNVLNISPDSKVTIAKYENNPGKDQRNVELKVDYGKVRASVEQQYDGEKNKFNIRTPTAVAGVRGTDFLAGFNPQTRQTQVITFSGVVAVGQAGAGGTITNPVFVKPGQSTSVGEGQAPEAPKAMPKKDVQEMNRESQAEASPNKGNADSAGPNTQTQKDDKKADEKKDAGTKGEIKNTENAPAAENKNASSEGQKSNSSASDNRSGENRSAAPGSASTNDAKPGDRAPSSTSPGSPTSMISKTDLDTGSISKDIQVVDTPKAPMMIKSPTPTGILPTNNNAITEIIQNKNSRVKIEFCLPGRC